jgi:two-component system cell cycle response regulator
MSDLRSRANTRHSGVIIMLPHGDSERAATALDLGANDISYEPFLAPELAVRIRTQLERKTRADRLRATLNDGLRLAVTDSLTGLYNRRYGMRHLERVARQCKDKGTDAAAIMIDVDHFKTVNDAFGHLVGDAILKEVAATLRMNLRGEDLVTRIGGEEFLAVLPDAGVEQAQVVAERLRSGIENLKLSNGRGGTIGVTLSLGVAMLSASDHDTTLTLQAVDRALYEAKAAGRNNVIISA